MDFIGHRTRESAENSSLSNSGGVQVTSQFTTDEWSRPHGETCDFDGRSYSWDAVVMGWRPKYGGAVIYPDHQRREADPSFAPIYGLLRRKLSRDKKHLHLVVSN